MEEIRHYVGGELVILSQSISDLQHELQTARKLGFNKEVDFLKEEIERLNETETILKNIMEIIKDRKDLDLENPISLNI